LRASVDNYLESFKKTAENLRVAPILPSVVGHESDRRKGKTLPKRRPASEREDRAKQAIAGTAETGGQRPGHPKLIGVKTPQDNPG